MFCIIMLLTFMSMKKQTVCIGERDKPNKKILKMMPITFKN